MKSNDYEILIQEDCWSIEFITEEHLTYQLCLSAVKKARKKVRNNRSILAFIPKQYFTIELCKIALERNGDALRDIPFELRTPDLCELAVQQYGEALVDVPKQYRTRELCQMAVNTHGMALADVPTKWIDFELARTAVRLTPRALAFVPSDLKTVSLYIEAYCYHPAFMAKQNIPQNILEKVMSGQD